MATSWSSGAGRTFVRTLRRASCDLQIGAPSAPLVRGGLLLLAATHIALILAAMPDAGLLSGNGPIAWMLASALTVIALAIITPAPPTPGQPATESEPVSPPAPELIELLARINHDLRTPLNAVIGFSEAMQREMFGPLGNVRYQEYARHIRDSGDILLRATEETLAMTSLLAAPPRVGRNAVALDEVLDAIRAELNAEGSEAAVVVHGETQACVEADPDALLQAVRHVVRSAVVHSGGLTPVEIDASVTQSRISMTILVGRLPHDDNAPRFASEAGLGRETLALCLARTLLRLQGMGLACESSASAWHARIDMLPAPVTNRTM